MVQLGLSLQQLIATMEDHYDLHLPFLFSKLNIKYGLWCMVVSDEDAWNLCYVLPFITPIKSIDDTKTVAPNSLQMGKCEIPPLFWSIKETVNKEIPLPLHPFKHILIQKIQQDSTQPSSSNLFVTIIEVFLDAFISATNNYNIDHLTHVSQCLLHVNHPIIHY